MSITNDCMTVNISLGMWSGARFDKDATKRLTTQAGAADDAARVNKHLAPRSELKPIVSAANAIRGHFYDKTLPWKDNGDRLLTRKMYQDFMQEHAQLADVFDTEADNFCDVRWPKIVEKAAFRMGEMFNPEEYPSSDEIRRRFYVRIDVDAVTTGNDFRVDIEEEERERIQEQMNRALQKRVNKAIGDLWGRISTSLGHFHDKTADQKAIFRNSTIKNLEEIIELIPKLNLTDDPDLATIQREMEDKLKGLDADDLRKDAHYRSRKANEAKEIMDQMKGFMKAHQGS